MVFCYARFELTIRLLVKVLIVKYLTSIINVIGFDYKLTVLFGSFVFECGGVGYTEIDKSVFILNDGFIIVNFVLINTFDRPSY